MSEESTPIPADLQVAAVETETTTIALKRPARLRAPKAAPIETDATARLAAEPAIEAAPAVAPASPEPIAPLEPVARIADSGPATTLAAADPARPAEPAPSRLSKLLASWRATMGDALTPPTLARYGAYAGAAIIALGAGWTGAHFLNATSRNASASVAFAAQTDARLEKLSEDIRLLRESVATLAKPARSPENLKPLNDRIAALAESIDRFRADQSGKISALAASIERAEKADKENSARVAQIVERLDRSDRAAPATTGSIPAPSAQAALSPPNPPPRPDAERPNVTAIEQKPAPKQIEGWALRDIYDGMALIENRRVGLVEVQPGQMVRGLGRIERIERRAGRWVVVTDQGVIAAN